jgi:uncharacterized protein YdhG (YjbR/CyaY superfamily)
MKSPKFKSVDEYLASQAPAKARTLRSVIDFILTQFLELQSKISWNVPTIHRKGKYVFGFAAYKHHLTLAPWSPRVIEDFKVRLGKFRTTALFFGLSPFLCPYRTLDMERPCPSTTYFEKFDLTIRRSY